ncbi:hypothetical protein J437_LFUL006560 [Ladona fulva]|uniref:Thiamine transporter 2 n=1 Tax=Ladona fulva TaxID=123851 RepID=A0A8K0KIR3_LADFU|nr:hypothetical protein J437_LFUL006560 [Ladona fulva]
MAAVAVIQGLVMILSAMTKELWVAYLCYIIFGILYQAMVTVASMEVAKKIEDDCYGLIFGLNTFVALVIQTIWVIVAVTDVGLALGARDQFLVTGGYFIILGMIFLIIALITTTRMGFRVFLKQSLWLPKPVESYTAY